MSPPPPTKPGNESLGGDLVGPLVRIAAMLRRVGLAITVDRVALAAESLGHWRLSGDSDPYWPLRISFCSSQADVLAFDAMYERWFQGTRGDNAMSHEMATIQAHNAAVSDLAPADTASKHADSGAGNAGDLSTRDFEDMTDDQVREISAWTELLRPMSMRLAMRHRPGRASDIDPALTMRLMTRNCGELLQVRYRRRASLPRRVLLIVDVSASMRPYSDVLIHFSYAVLRANPDSTGVIAVGTRWTYLTDALKKDRLDLALQAAGEVRADWGRGTTLGAALGDFLRRWGGSRVVRSAIVVLASDGFDFDDPVPLIAQTARLASLARMLVWVDPAHRGPSHRPADDHVARAQAQANMIRGCHSYDALSDLAMVITNA